MAALATTALLLAPAARTAGAGVAPCERCPRMQKRAARTVHVDKPCHGSAPQTAATRLPCHGSADGGGPARLGGGCCCQHETAGIGLPCQCDHTAGRGVAGEPAVLPLAMAAAAALSARDFVSRVGREPASIELAPDTPPPISPL